MNLYTTNKLSIYKVFFALAVVAALLGARGFTVGVYAEEGSPTPPPAPEEITPPAPTPSPEPPPEETTPPPTPAPSPIPPPAEEIEVASASSTADSSTPEDPLGENVLPHVEENTESASSSSEAIEPLNENSSSTDGLFHDNGNIDGENGSSTPSGDAATSTDDGTDGSDGTNGGVGGPAEIYTGDAGAAANTVNNTNANILGSQGFFSILNFFSPLLSDLDLRNASSLSSLTDACGSNCSLLGDSQLNSLNNNSSSITNTIDVAAISGDNVTMTQGGVTRIITGASDAASNIVNIANTNIIGSEYILLVLNNFSDWAGDIVFPGQDFFSQLVAPPPPPPPPPPEVFPGYYMHPATGKLCHVGGYDFEWSDFGLGEFYEHYGTSTPNEELVGAPIESTTPADWFGWWDAWKEKKKKDCPPLTSTYENNNSATIKNNVGVGAETGNNSAFANAVSTTPGGEIITGDATAASNILTLANTNVQNSDSVFILLRVFGDWSGEVMSLPSGLSWQETNEGILIYSSTPSVLLGTELGGSGDVNGACCGAGAVSSTNNNQAVIENNVRVLALTGENQVGEGGTIVTGDATAVSNVVNIANTNIVGKNWILAIINIFGDWNGNLAFGRPDLWVAQRAVVPSDPVVAGTEVTYYVDILNNGDAPATNVEVSTTFAPLNLMDMASVEGASVSAQGTSWSIPSLPVGASTTLMYTARVGEALPQGQSVLTVTANARSTETDANDEDNTDSLTLAVQGPTPPQSGGGGGGVGGFSIGSGGGYGSGDATITMTKTGFASSTFGTSTVAYKLVLKNSGSGSSFDTHVNDALYDPMGTMIATSSWDLGVVYPGEEITIDYDAFFSGDAMSGMYTNEAWVEGEDSNGKLKLFAHTSSTIVIVQDVQEPAPTNEVEAPVSSTEKELVGVATLPNILGAQMVRRDIEAEPRQVAHASPEPVLFSDQGTQSPSLLMASLRGVLSVASDASFWFVLLLLIGVRLALRRLRS